MGKKLGLHSHDKKEFLHTTKDLKTVVNPNLVHFVDVENEPAGFFVALLIIIRF